MEGEGLVELVGEEFGEEDGFGRGFPQEVAEGAGDGVDFVEPEFVGDAVAQEVDAGEAGGAEELVGGGGVGADGRFEIGREFGVDGAGEGEQALGALAGGFASVFSGAGEVFGAEVQ